MAGPMMTYLGVLAMDPDRGVDFDEARAVAAGLSPAQVAVLAAAWGTNDWTGITAALNAENPELAGRFQFGGNVHCAFGLSP